MRTWKDDERDMVRDERITVAIACVLFLIAIGIPALCAVFGN